MTLMTLLALVASMMLFADPVGVGQGVLHDDESEADVDVPVIPYCSAIHWM